MTTRRAFTVVELLVVVASLAVLCSIMLPMLQRVQRNSRINLCLLNQRTLTLANAAYAMDNNMCLVSARTDTTASPKDPSILGAPHCWVKAQDGNLVHYQERASSIEQGSLYPYVGYLKFYVSPNEPINPRTQALGLGDTRVRSYSFNGYLGCRSLNEWGALGYLRDGATPSFKVSPASIRRDHSRLTMVKHPGKMMSTIAEDNEISYNYAGWWVCDVHPVWYHWPARWQPDAMTLSFVDGSFETHSLRDPLIDPYWMSIPHRPGDMDGTGGQQAWNADLYRHAWEDPRLPDWRYYRDRLLPGQIEPSPGAFEHDND